MNQNRSIVIVLIVVIIVLAGAIAYFVLNQTYSNSTSQVTVPVSNQISTTPQPVTPVTTNRVSNSEGKLISVSGPMSYSGNGKFLGNDPFGFSWSSNYPTISPVVYLYNSSNVKVYSKNLSGGSEGSSARTGESTAPNQNLATGSYKIELCDLGVQDSSGNVLCGSSNYFNVTATNNSFQP